MNITGLGLVWSNLELFTFPVLALLQQLLIYTQKNLINGRNVQNTDLGYTLIDNENLEENMNWFYSTADLVWFS